jgi:phosphoribosylamine--glycine ligase
MKILLVGDGAREHVIAEAIARDSELYAVMGKKNPAIALLSKKSWVVDMHNPLAVTDAIRGEEFDVAFVSPDAVIAAGVSDAFISRGIKTASPTKAACRIEWDKYYARMLMDKYRIGCNPDHVLATTAEEAAKVINEYTHVAVKPLGLTGGKGVKVSGDHLKSTAEAQDYAKEVIAKDGKVLIEEKLDGEEFSLFGFSDGKKISFMPPVQDHKRAFCGDSGPNTGGMGAYSTGKLLPFMKKEDLDAAKKTMEQTVRVMAKEKNPFVGVLYGGFMICTHGIKLIEYNARFGDPEAMNVVPLIRSSLSEVLLSMAEGRLKKTDFANKCTVLKYLVPEGYPGNSKKDAEVLVDNTAIKKLGGRVYYAAVYEKERKIYTTSSRTFGMLGIADSIAEAEQIAEKACSFVSGPLWHRSDIGTTELIEKRVKHMEELRLK